MKFFSKLTLITLAAAPLLPQDSQQGQTPQRELGVVRGTVRAETGELVVGATLTLSLEPPPSIVDSLKSLASSMGIPPGEVQGALGRMMTQTLESLEGQLAQAKATGNAPAALVDIFSQVLAMRTSAKGFPLRATSDSNGQFTFSNLPAGIFTLRVHSDDGYLGTGSNRVRHLDHDDVSLPVTVNTLLTTVTVPMIRGAIISGRLRNADGRPASNVSISAMVTAYNDNGGRSFAPLRSARTDDTGGFRLFWLNPGQYFLMATPTLSNGALTTFYPGTLEPTANPILVSAGQEVSGLDFSIQTGRTVTVSGEVIESGTPASPIRADGSPGSPRTLTIRLLRQPGIGSPPIQRTFSIVEGNNTAFEFREVPPATYHLFANTAANLRSATSVRVGDKDVTGIQVEVRPNTTVTGVVTLDGMTPPRNSGARIALSPFDPDGKTVSEGPRRSEGVPIAPGGGFSVANNPWGRYATRVIGFPPDSYVDEVQQGGLNVYDSGINVTGDTFRFATDQITVKVKTNGGRIEGVVQSADRKPSSGSVVVLVPPFARRRNPSLFMATTSGSNGRFSLRGIQPGEYKLFAWENLPWFVEGAWQNADFLAGYESQGHVVSIASSVSTQVEIVAAR